MFAVCRGRRLGALEIGTEPRFNLRFEFAGGKVGRGGEFLHSSVVVLCDHVCVRVARCLPSKYCRGQLAKKRLPD